jgi:hypothetical protein
MAGDRGGENGQAVVGPAAAPGAASNAVAQSNIHPRAAAGGPGGVRRERHALMSSVQTPAAVGARDVPDRKVKVGFRSSGGSRPSPAVGGDGKEVTALA